MCLLVLSSQILPMKRIGQLLSSNSIQEEVPHSLAVEKQQPVKFFNYNDAFISSVSNNFVFNSIGDLYIHFVESLPANHTGEFLVPPPNCNA